MDYQQILNDQNKITMNAISKSCNGVVCCVKASIISNAGWVQPKSFEGGFPIAVLKVGV